jgi:hypothetical protein
MDFLKKNFVGNSDRNKRSSIRQIQIRIKSVKLRYFIQITTRYSQKEILMEVTQHYCITYFKILQLRVLILRLRKSAF